MSKLKPKDIIALTIIIGIGFMKLKGFDGYLDSVVALVIGYYFAHRKNGDDTGE